MDHDDPGGAHAACLNCGTPLIGAHCHACGQSAHIHRTLRAIGHDVMHGALHLEGTLWRTLPMLIRRPGELTRRYVAGERTRFVSPMALFLFSIFALFTTFSVLGIAPPADVGTARAQAGMDYARNEARDARKALIERRGAMTADDPKRAEIDRQIAKNSEDLAMLERITPDLGNTAGDGHIETGWHRLDKGLEKARKNPGLMMYKIQANSYKFSWLLIPLSLPFMWLLFFWKRRIHVYDHSVFVTYSIAFMSLWFVVLTIAAALGVATAVLWTVGPVLAALHLYRQLRGAYGLRRWSALARATVLIVFINVIAVLFLLLLIGLGLIG